MTKKKAPAQVKQILASINNKRAQIVIEHILENGFITTEQLEKDYGYNHPPRAARDVREAGIPLETFRVKSSEGRSIAAYRFGDFSKIKKGKLQGRRVFSKSLKDRLYRDGDKKCYICTGHFEKRYMQIDHRVPYEISGDLQKVEQSSNDFMLLCGSCNRAKSWSCEHCLNWQDKKISDVCKACYWANPVKYEHIALEEIRRLDIQWEGDEIQIYETLRSRAFKNNVEIPGFVKEIIAKAMSGK